MQNRSHTPNPLSPAASVAPLSRLALAYRWGVQRLAALDALQPLAALLARLYVAQVFFLAGLTKLRDWETTVFLFTEEYHVPLLPPAWAAVAGTAGELVLPVLLVLGLGGRLAALGLFVVNAVAVVSLAELAPAAWQQHVLWGTLAAGLAVYGSGAWSLDRFLARAPRG
jgi:putative oxidoreductase